MNLQELEKKLHYIFTNRELATEALTHKSCKKPYNNERLEFLGDAVLDLIVGEYLYTKFPKACEGELSKIRAALVSEKGFIQLAVELDLGKHIAISAAEENNNGRQKPSILSNAFEALMGAIYLESGLETVRGIVRQLLEKVHPKIDLPTLFSDYKTALQELTQARFGVTPTYLLVGSSGPDHKKEFIVAVSIADQEYARASGGSKKEAEQKAAKETMDMLSKGEA